MENLTKDELEKKVTELENANEAKDIQIAELTNQVKLISKRYNNLMKLYNSLFAEYIDKE